MSFTHLVCVGDSWTWGADLTDHDRQHAIFPVLLSQQLSLPLVNLGISSATNFNYKWLLTEWFNHNPNARPLVVVGITSPLRLLIYDNQLRDFQHPKNYILVSDRAFPSVYGGHNKIGGYRGIQLADPYALRIQNDIGAVGENFIRYQLDDEYRDVEIAAIWEIIMLHHMIVMNHGTPVFWSNLWDFSIHRNDYFEHSCQRLSLVNQLLRLLSLEESRGHPDRRGHQTIAQRIFDHIQLTLNPC